MLRLPEDSMIPLARSASALGRIIEAHADGEDNIRKVVIELSESLQNLQLREAVLQLWRSNGFIASVSRDGYLMIDGLVGREFASDWDLIAAVSHQIKEYTKASMHAQAAADMVGESPADIAFMAKALRNSSDPLSAG